MKTKINFSSAAADASLSIPTGHAIELGWLSKVMLAVCCVLGLVVFTWPLFVAPGSAMSNTVMAPIILAVFVPLVLAMVLVQLANGEMDVKALSLLGVLTALGAIARPLGAGTGGIDFVFFFILLAGRVFGPGFGFILGNTTLFASAFLVGGVGYWLPYQMLAAGFVGLGSGLLPRCGVKLEIVLLAGYGLIASHLYGMLMDLAFWPFFFPSADSGFNPEVGVLENLHRFLIVNLATGFGWNMGRAITNVILIVALGSAILRVLRRAGRQAHFVHSSSNSSSSRS